MRSSGNLAIIEGCIRRVICKRGGPSLGCKAAGSQHSCHLARQCCSSSPCSSLWCHHRASRLFASVESQLYSFWPAWRMSSRPRTSNRHRFKVGSFVCAFRNQSQCVNLVAHANTSPSCRPAAQPSAGGDAVKLTHVSDKPSPRATAGALGVRIKSVQFISLTVSMSRV